MHPDADPSYGQTATLEAREEPQRTRINMSQTAKGLWQIEVTAEYRDTDTSANELERAIQRCKEIAERNGLPLAGS